MDWITGMQNAINYIEDNLTEKLDYEEIAKNAYVTSFHFQRVFGIMCGYTVGEYIRNRRLTLAGNELTLSYARVIDIALKYQYDNPDSFGRAFLKFHGITPSAAREQGAKLKSFGRLKIKIYMEGGCIMDYRIEQKEKMIFTGYKRKFEGTPGNTERRSQENDFYLSTRANQYILDGLSDDAVKSYNIITNIGDDGYDFYIAALLEENVRTNLKEDDVLGEGEARRFEQIEVPALTYAVFETEKSQWPTAYHCDLRKKIVSEWLPSSDYFLADGPEIVLTHWFRGEKRMERYIEIWLPVEKK